MSEEIHVVVQTHHGDYSERRVCKAFRSKTDAVRFAEGKSDTFAPTWVVPVTLE